MGSVSGLCSMPRVLYPSPQALGRLGSVSRYSDGMFRGRRAVLAPRQGFAAPSPNPKPPNGWGLCYDTQSIYATMYTLLLWKLVTSEI